MMRSKVGCHVARSFLHWLRRRSLVWPGSLAACLPGETTPELSSQRTSGLLVLPCMAFMQGEPPLFHDVLLEAGAGVFATLGTLVNLRALSMGSMSLAAPIMGVANGMVGVCAGPIIGEPFTILFALAIACALFAIWNVAPRRNARDSNVRLVIILALTASICIGSTNISARYSTHDGLWYLTALRIVALVGLAPFVFQHRHAVRTIPLMRLVPFAASIMLGDLSVVVALHRGDISIVGLLVALSPVVIVAIAFVFLASEPRVNKSSVSSLRLQVSRCSQAPSSTSLLRNLVFKNELRGQKMFVFASIMTRVNDHYARSVAFQISLSSFW